LRPAIRCSWGKGKAARRWILSGSILERRARKIEAVRLDMGRAYVKAVSEHPPSAKIIFDKFHVVKLMNGRTKKNSLSKINV
jgi:transposase